MHFKIKSASLIAALIMIFGAAAFFANESNAQGKTYKIGDKGPAGGWVFYDKGNSDDGWRYLEAAPVDQTTKDGAEWSCYKKSIPGARGTAIGTGKSNTEAIVKSCGEAKIAAKLCTAYRGGGKSDWFLPSKDELNLMYAILCVKGVGSFADNHYWSSSQNLAGLAWYQSFGNVLKKGTIREDNVLRVRAVRAFNN